MTDFSQTITDWQTFYLLTGTAAATLIGLLFIAISINTDIFHGKSRLDLRHFAGLTFNCFFYALVVSLLFLMPGLTPLGLGLPLLLIAGAGLANTVIQQRRARRAEAGRGDIRIASRFTIPILCLSGLVIIAASVIMQITQSLYGVVAVVIFLLGSAAVNAWTLLMRAGGEA